MSFQAFRARISLIAWLFPVAVMVVGAFFDTLPITMTFGLLVQVLLLGAWLIAENSFASSPDTNVGQLKSDAFLSILLALILSFFGGWLLALGKCPWYYLAPAAATIGDAFMTSKHALNSLYQRRLIARDVDHS